MSEEGDDEKGVGRAMASGDREAGFVDENGYPKLAVTFGAGGTAPAYLGGFPAFMSAWGGPLDQGIGVIVTGANRPLNWIASADSSPLPVAGRFSTVTRPIYCGSVTFGKMSQTKPTMC